MKTQASQVPPPPPAFSPLKLEITFESQQELDAFASLLNQSPVDAALAAAGFRDAYLSLAKPLRNFGACISERAYDRINESLRRSYSNL